MAASIIAAMRNQKRDSERKKTPKMESVIMEPMPPLQDFIKTGSLERR